MHHDTSSIADSFANATTRDGIAVEIGLLPCTEDELDYCEDREGGDEECVQAKVWIVAIDGVLNSAEPWTHVRAILGDEVPPHCTVTPD